VITLVPLEETAMSDMYPAPSVVVGIDGSRAARHAALWAIDEAVSRDIPVRLVCVIDPSDHSSAGGYSDRLGAARAALHDAYQATDATGHQVKVDCEILWGSPLTKLLEESRSAAVICVGSVGRKHASRGGGSIAATVAASARCPVAVVRPGRRAIPRVSTVAAQVENGAVLRHAFEEARLRGATLRAISVSCAEAPDDAADGNRLSQVHMNRRLQRWTRLYPDVAVQSAVVAGSVDRYLAANDEADQLFVTDSHTCRGLCGARNDGRSVLAVPCGHG
jgi:nucleotide-binding universal stress UspA family protein